MPIRFSCSCGEQLEVDDALAGQQARCPYCEAVVTVPAADAPPPAKRARLAEPEETHDDRGAYSTSLNPLEGRDRPPSRRRDDRDEEEDDRPRRRVRSDDDDPDERPRRRSYDSDDPDEDYRPRRRTYRDEPPAYKLFNNQVVGGITAIILGVAVFVLALYFEIVCLRWLLVLVIGGIISLIRGLITGRDN